MSRHRNRHATRPGKPIKGQKMTLDLIAVAKEEDVDDYAMAPVEDCRYRRIISLAGIFYAGYNAEKATHVDILK